jgi:hypothetical protein
MASTLAPPGLLGAVLISLLSTACSAADSGTPPPPGLPSTDLLYVSDYFSFVGNDSQGHVAFALDNNRGRDGDRYQAEHFVVLHDERAGWIDLAGSGSYANVQKELAGIPDSPFFQFAGTPAGGITISSTKNNLTLKIAPIPQHQRRTHDQAAVWMGSAAATLFWQERKIPGRVIYEYLAMPNFNRLTRTYWGMWKEFQGLYLLAGGSSDVYLHSQRIAALVGTLTGFAVLTTHEAEPMTDLEVSALDHDFAPGLYRWPTAWRITWKSHKGRASMTMRLSERKGIANWVIGGFSMGIVQGELSYDGRIWPVYGLAELIM